MNIKQYKNASVKTQVVSRILYNKPNKQKYIHNGTIDTIQ